MLCTSEQKMAASSRVGNQHSEFNAYPYKKIFLVLAWNTLSTWLCSNSYAGSVESIQAVGKWKCRPKVMPTLQLPFSRLKQLKALKLPQCQVKAAIVHDSADSAATELSSAFQQQSLGALTALSRLELIHTWLDLGDLINCTALRHLEPDNVGHFTVCDPAADTAAAPFAVQSTEGGTRFVECFWPTQLTDALPALNQLTLLDITYFKSETDGEQQQVDITISLSNLQQLQVLGLNLTRSHIIDLTGLPVSLTQLKLFRPPVLSLGIMHHLMQLTQLQQLSLISASEFPPLLLSRMTQLTGLAIACCKIRSAATLNVLMQAVRHLRQLRKLDMPGSLHDHAHTSSPGMYAALTASSQLTSLYVTKSCFHLEANRYVFAAGNPSRSLKVLAASADLFACPGSFERVATCCPRLLQLEVNNDSQTDQEDLDLQGVSELTRLSALTNLTLFGLDLTDELLGSVAACTGLKDLLLDIDPWQKITVSLAGLMQLTQLTGLTRLSLYTQLADGVFEKAMTSTGSPADVFLQLQQALASYGQ